MNSKKEYNASLVSYSDIPASGFTGPHFPAEVDELNSAYVELLQRLGGAGTTVHTIIDELQLCATALTGYVGYVPLVTGDRYKWFGAIAFGKGIYEVKIVVGLPNRKNPTNLERSIALYSTGEISYATLSRLCSNYAMHIRQGY